MQAAKDQFSEADGIKMTSAPLLQNDQHNSKRCISIVWILRRALERSPPPRRLLHPLKLNTCKTLRLHDIIGSQRFRRDSSSGTCRVRGEVAG